LYYLVIDIKNAKKMFGKKLYLFFLFVFFAQFANAQLSNFTLTVTKTDELCNDSGTLSFSVSNTTAGSVILYSVYLLPNTTVPISVQSATTLSGLSSGTYSVIATQTLGANSGTQQQNITILDLVNPLLYQVASTNEICGNDGTITVSVTNGTPFNYEIFSGPMTRPLQSSNTFTGLTAGVYQIRVFDECNQGVVQTFTLLSSDTDLNLTIIPPYLTSCTNVSIGFSFATVLPTPQGVVRYPLQVVTTVFLPTGTQTINSTISSGTNFAQTVIRLDNQPYNYSFSVIDGCGTAYNLTGIVPNLALAQISYTIAPQDCFFMLTSFSNVTALTMTAAPTTYGGFLPQSFTGLILNNRVNVGNLTAGTYVFNAVDICGIPQLITVVVVLNDLMGLPPYSTLYNRTCFDATVFIYDIEELIMTSAPSAYTAFTLPHDFSNLINFANYAVLVNLPVGTYTFEVIDQCGNPRPFTVIIEPESLPPTVAVLEGCSTGIGSFQITGQISSITLVSAPPAYNVSLPVNFTSSISGGKLTLDNLPPGTYSFQSVNACNVSFNTNVTVLGYLDNSNVIVTPNCGSFNLSLTHSSNNNLGSRFWLQKLNPLTNDWGHPLTNVVYTSGAPTLTNSIPLSITMQNLNLAYSGHFRILKAYNVYVAGNVTPITCLKVIDEFDFSDGPRIIDIYSVSCGSTFEVVVNAVGNSALVYRITTKNNQPFLIENGSSSLFSGLAPAIYNFEVEDVCQNTVSNQFEVLNPVPLEITASPIICDGDTASLSVPFFSFLTYKWWKDNNTATVLSTSGSLNFPSFNAAANNGTYHVMITYLGNPNSCLNQTLNYTINISNTLPQAGNNNTLSYCGTQGTINMTTLLSGTFDALGIWSETTSSGMLANNLWNSTNVAVGTYQFKYTVTGTCGTTDEATINITIKEVPQIPIASVDPIICEENDLNLFATSLPNSVTYYWFGPNGFTSSQQNPIISSISPTQNGVYTVYAAQNECNSGESSVTVLVNPQPDFILAQDCVDNQYQVWAIKQNEISYNETTATFNWTGPNGFTSNQPSITITGGEVGLYSLTVVNENGCETTNAIPVERTNCFIPNVITPNNDGTNDAFDLTGFNVDKLEIFSRWGRKVYEKSNYLDEWHGQNMSGEILPDSTYYYIIKLAAETETKMGWIFLSKG
jgi:gliding motility-associated-like protein